MVDALGRRNPAAMQGRLPACSVTIIMVKHERASRGESRAGVAAQSRGDRRPFHEKATSVKAVLRDLRRLPAVLDGPDIEEDF